MLAFSYQPFIHATLQVIRTLLIPARARLIPLHRTRASKIETLVKAALPSTTVSINPEKPRKGCFEVTANGKTIVSLTDMPRPFAKLKALDIEALAKEVVDAM